MYTPKVSVVIPAYNASNYLAEAIDSALSQTYKNFEIIVVNDGSKDDGATERIALSYGDKIRYFCKENGGSSSALNMGIANMTGEWFSWLSHDDLYVPTKLETQIEYLRKCQFPEEILPNQVLFAASDLIDGNGETIRSANIQDSDANSRFIESLKGNEYLIAEPTRHTFHGCSCLIHKSVFDVVGAFDENLRLVNDADLWFRIYAAGYRIHFLPQTLVKGRIHGKQVSKTAGYSYHNPEQDMFWNRSLDWLLENHPQNQELFFLYGRNAYIKTRYAEGDRAFDYLARMEPAKKIELQIRKNAYKFYATVRNFGKQVFLKLRV